MAIKVKLKDIINGLDMQSDNGNVFLNKETGSIEEISEEYFMEAEDYDPDDDHHPDWEKELIETAREISETEPDKYIALPSKFDIHEYEIMERFCLSIEDDKLMDTMYRSIKGSGAFRRFKDNIRRYGIEEDWYKYRDSAFKEIAIEWCKDNDIEFTED